MRILRWTIRRPAAGLAAAVLCASAVAATDVYRFAVDLDGRPIGTHQFVVTREGDRTEVRSDARFDVKLLGVPLYRYRHEATERWTEGCLVSIDSKTDRNGRRLAVDWKAPAGGGPCESSFAYWDPGLLARPRLLNPETGRFEKASLTAVEGRRRLVAESVAVDLHYSAEARWTGLDATTEDGRRLRYRGDAGLRQ